MVLANQGIPLALVASLYLHVEDSDGTKTPAEGEALLAFHPTGAAFLAIASGKEEPRIFEGSFALRGGKLALHFGSKGFVREARFPIDLGAPTIAVPFKLYSRGAGSSTWRSDSGETRYGSAACMFVKGAIVARRQGAAEAMKLVDDYLRLLVAPPGRPPPSFSPAPPMMRLLSYHLGELSVRLEYQMKNGPFSLTSSLCGCAFSDCL